MQRITQRKVLIKDYPWLSIAGIVTLSVIACVFLTLKTDTEILVGTEQALFVILSAILFVFHETIIGFQSISKVRNKINQLKSQEVKNRIISIIGLSDIEKDYEEFLTTVDKEMVIFKDDVRKFRRNSYLLYVIFSMLGLLIILSSLVDPHSSVLGSIYVQTMALYKIKIYAINFFLFGQLFLIPSWMISAFQAERQKSAMFQYLTAEQIAPNVSEYIKAKRSKEINLSIDAQFSD